MKKYFAALLVLAGTIIITSPIQVSALDYHIEGLLECQQSKSQSSECKKLYCERDNIEKNWPVNIGHYEDCSKYEKHNTRYLTAGILGVLGITGTILIITKLSKNKTVKWR